MSKVEKLRLDRLLANLGYGSRKEIQQLVRNGSITFDEKAVIDCEQKIELQEDVRFRLRVKGEVLDPLPGVVLILHKPLGLTCSHREEGGLVYDLLPDRWRLRNPAISTVGRLDKDTSGLLLLTDDGTLLHRVTSPKKAIPKSYMLTLDRPLRGDEEAIFSSGTLLLEGENKPLLPATMHIHSATSVSITIWEGRYHQVRRMFAAVGNHVLTLHRSSIGGLSMPTDLLPGKFQILKEEDIATLFV